MDLGAQASGLTEEEGSPIKKRGVTSQAEKDQMRMLQEVVENVSKLILWNAQQARFLKAIVMNYKMRTDSNLWSRG
eukprot:5537315-Karenia_brevis.AAC.1